MGKNFTSPIPSAIGNQPKPKKQPVHNQKMRCDSYLPPILIKKENKETSEIRDQQQAKILT
jgi:hypothetical protein